MNAKLPSIFVSLEQFENITVIENCENPIENNIINTFESIDIIDTSGEEKKKIFTVYMPAHHYLKSWKIQVINRLINKTFYFTQDIDAFLYLNDEIQKTFVPLFQDVIQQDIMSINQYRLNALQMRKNETNLKN